MVIAKREMKDNIILSCCLLLFKNFKYTFDDLYLKIQVFGIPLGINTFIDYFCKEGTLKKIELSIK